MGQLEEANPLRRAGSRLRSGLRRRAFGRDVSGEVNDLQAAVKALHVAVADAVRDLGEDIREGLRAETLRRTDLLVERIDRKVEGLFAELHTREDLGTFFTGESHAAFDEQFGEPSGRPANYAGLFEKGPVADLACRRGDLLEALRDAGVEAHGVAPAAGPVDTARARGFTVYQEGPVEHLARLPDGQLTGVVALQVAEHLSPAGVEQLFVEALRALAPGGLLVLETPNPLSLLGLERWLRDPTHRWIIHPDTLRFVAGRAGFGKARIGFVGGDSTSRGAPDYALIARRPGDPAGPARPAGPAGAPPDAGERTG
ncbi:MAG TPA: methyltransferase domain-containing protein [Actinomycetota bacterium]